MSDIQKILNDIADKLAVFPPNVLEVKLRTISVMLNYLSSYSHGDAVIDALKGETKDA